MALSVIGSEEEDGKKIITRVDCFEKGRPYGGPLRAAGEAINTRRTREEY